ncbi:hypothetical protein GGX14DRAFT_572475 [Mycena pura]|uniref:DUF6589 domain-containing protein n=1 Tax=Mycena pura TaxID=153505 RepID=A0AAD6V1F8_9AGAR|nr:hypothetical protein GGX14DRAFT_572475 [Mycena pura]
MSNPPQNSAPVPSKRRKTKPRVTLPGTSRFSLDADSLPPATSRAAPETIHVAALDSGFCFRAPITPASGPHAFTRRADVNTLGSFVRTDAPIFPRLEDPREPFDESFDPPDFSALHSSHGLSTESLSEVLPGESPFTMKPRGCSDYDKIHSIIQHLRSLQISPFQLILQVLNPDDWQYEYHRSHLYREGSTRLSELVDAMMHDEHGKTKLLDCMRPHLLDFACKTVAEEMENRREVSIVSGIGVVTPEFIDAWNIEEEVDTTPFLTRILETAAQTKHAAAHNKIKHPQKMCRVVTRQLLYQSSNRCLSFQAEFGLFLWATGCARQTIDALFRCGLSVSYDSVLSCVESLSFHCDAKTLARSKDVHGFSYDNMNLSTSIFVEQRGSSGPAKVTSGTFGILYGLRNALAEHMLIAPIMQRFRKSQGLQFNLHLRPALPQLRSFHNQLVVTIMDRLIAHQPGFEVVAKDPLLQHVARRPFPVGWITPEFPTRATTIEEATTRGNLLYHDEIYLNQFKRTTDSLSKYAIPSINDQLTNARIRAGQILRARDTNAWNRREVFQLAFGLFHLCLNLVWGILHAHRGTVNMMGSLSYFFSLMEKTRLGNDQPDYHTLLAALTQILDGLLLSAWRRECGSVSLEAFAKSKPTAQQLRDIATRILNEYATPFTAPDPEPDSDSPDVTENSDSEEEVAPRADTSKSAKQDIAHHNIRLLTRDLLIVTALTRAISDGDFGRIEDFLPQLAMIFRGLGCNKYCTEILHFLHNLKVVWTPEFGDIMRDNMIICISGRGPGHCMGVDMNIEHLIGYLKAKGMTSTWDRLGNVSASIVYLQRVKKKVAAALETAYRSTGHTTPDTSALVWRVADKVTSEGLQQFEDGRVNNASCKLTVDAMLTGEAKLKSSTLATFNKNMLLMIKGHSFEEEEDECPTMAYGTTALEDDLIPTVLT